MPRIDEDVIDDAVIREEVTDQHQGDELRDGDGDDESGAPDLSEFGAFGIKQ